MDLGSVFRFQTASHESLNTALAIDGDGKQTMHGSLVIDWSLQSQMLRLRSGFAPSELEVGVTARVGMS